MVLACDSGSFFPQGGSRAEAELLKTRTRGGRRNKNEESGRAVCRGAWKNDGKEEREGKGSGSGEEKKMND